MDKGNDHPIILALETATMCGSVALLAGESCLAEYSLDTSTTHSRRLNGQIERIMADTGTDWHDLGAIGISIGPGSFTGLRIGLSTAKGMAMGTGLPLVAIPTLDGLARQLPSPPGTRVCTMLDARKKEVYAGLYSCDENGIPRRDGDLMAIRPERLVEKLDGDHLLAGDGVEAYRELFTSSLPGSTVFVPPSVCYPRASAIAGLALERFLEGDTDDSATLVPLYVRPSEAEINLKSRPS